MLLAALVAVDSGEGARMQRTMWTKVTVVATIALGCAMSGCRNGPNNAADTNGVSTGGAAGQVLPSAADTVHHDTTARDTSRRRP
ncbi:MAG: hypothetical protein ACHQWU_04355 [Gemmatimonadales bacterium]